MGYPFYILDVFTAEKYAGNQLAVFRHTALMSSDEMQLIAREMNFSESTFIHADLERGSGFDVRIFTPSEEIPFAGHPTLGTAYVIQQEIIRREVPSLTLNLKVGPIKVDLDYLAGRPHMMWMKQVPPIFMQQLAPEGMAELLGVTGEDIDHRYPIQEVSTGLPFIIVPLKTLAAVKKCRPDTQKLLRYVVGLTAKNILVFSPETYRAENNFNVRVFTDYLGIPEDPATGSANGCLAAYLVKYRYHGSPVLVARVEQGYEVNRFSLLSLRAHEEGDIIHVHVGGQAVLVAKGEFI
ncbi:MAG: Trans-2,3-dihydro-3-hydroxyanthranilate isomerase [Firmicutes bacterium]|nr:Trans-2,3-dihydro-3-hydroxyanthranilate isomerase [Bacillota bacterium]